ncbi:ATP synthase subunit B [Thermosipho melanesiensis]|uniref:ATP synthase subunit b n=2 Tax=Thermosipho melanesiensis TaxID=46541 RepID=ATPF_THEM4|nr:F0F1 ATP synthase subunit B [Thermosipho melanesiensis]A6LJR5.1 RecName: Full=ATP synthase subunit b; AltName: Full=ATP synthase F(0) sector subunit b; AltName: Full=ATPase subunit I; AltName: Full=F-type ATPase subunit b; Short=F-ATPase subunit b [Thermosipho melanesiensis BI429]ABR30166.1 ATP synthase F0, B subunit [Thermosipho melanesiensis BI429]APT73365.1 ATP synthase subunit B [Thermosipho melanesiensis]OOC38180.1 ATP synthase subunit B [Thermosipho melanesiensis]OOC40101.1 ATP syntha
MDMFEINITSVIQLMSFFLLLYILKKFLYDKYFEVMDARKEKIEGEIKKAEQLRKEAEELKKEAKGELIKIRESADSIIKKAKEEAEEIVNNAKKKAEAEAEKILVSAKEEIKNEREAMIKEVEQRVGEIAVVLAMKILKGTLDEKAKREYLMKILKEHEK